MTFHKPSGGSGYSCFWDSKVSTVYSFEWLPNASDWIWTNEGKLVGSGLAPDNLVDGVWTEMCQVSFRGPGRI